MSTSKKPANLKATKPEVPDTSKMSPGQRILHRDKEHTDLSEADRVIRGLDRDSQR